MKSHGVVTRVPGKVNLQLSVGPLGADGFHEVTTVFQAISLFDDVTVTEGKVGSGTTISVTGQTANGVPADASNLAIRAAQLMMKEFELSPDLEIKLKKEIPVAGGMAGGSADAAGVIVGLDSLYELGLSRDFPSALESPARKACISGSLTCGEAIDKPSRKRSHS